MSNTIGVSGSPQEIPNESKSLLNVQQNELVRLLANTTEESYDTHLARIGALFNDYTTWFDSKKDDSNTEFSSFIEEINGKLEELFGVFFHEDFDLKFDYSTLSTELKKGLQDTHKRDGSVLFVHLLGGAIEKYGGKNANKYMRESLKDSETKATGKIQFGTQTFAQFRFKDNPDRGTSLYSYLLAERYLELLIHFFQYIHQQKQEALITGLLVDPLTQLPNRISTYMESNHYMKGVARFLDDDSARVSIPFSVLVLDADDFKRVNTLFGHDGGDQVLREFGLRIKAFLESGQFAGSIDSEELNKYNLLPFAGRLGGEEFVIMLPGFDEEQSLEFAQGLGRILGGTPIQIGEKEKKITATIGVSTLDITRDFLNNPPEDPNRKGDASVSGFRALGRLPASAHAIISLLFKQADSRIEALKSLQGKGRVGHFNRVPQHFHVSLIQKMVNRRFARLNTEVRGGSSVEKLVGSGNNQGLLGEFSNFMKNPRQLPPGIRGRVRSILNSKNRGK